MKGIIARTIRSFCLLTGLLGPLGLVGCTHYKDVVDTCYPERYNAMARKELTGAINPQIQNGHVLDQTVLDSHFKSGTAVLTPGGIEKLNYLARRRPCADTQLYLQTALINQDDESLQEKQLTWDPTKPEEMIKARNKLNEERKEAVKNYLAAATNGRGLAFNIETLDVATPYQPGITANNMMRIKIMAPPAGALPNTGGAVPGANVYGTTGAWQ
jgi:hypothetical protein